MDVQGTLENCQVLNVMQMYHLYFSPDVVLSEKYSFTIISFPEQWGLLIFFRLSLGEKTLQLLAT